MSVSSHDFLVVAANMRSESGVWFSPDVSLSDPRPCPLQRGITRDRQHRIGIRHRDRQPGEQVERARPRGGEADAELVGIHRVAAGHERGGLLVAGDDAADLCRVLQRQQQLSGVLARAAEGGFDVDAFESFDDGFVDPHLPRPSPDGLRLPLRLNVTLGSLGETSSRLLHSQRRYAALRARAQRPCQQDRSPLRAVTRC